MMGKGVLYLIPNTLGERIALDLMLQCGGTAYLPDVLVEPFIEQGSLHRLDALPEFKRDVYIAYHKENEHAQKLHASRRMLGKEEPEAPTIIVP